MGKKSSASEEELRLEVLNSLRLLDTPNEKDLDNIVSIASLVCSTPTAIVSLVDKERQWFKAKVGLDVCETPRGVAFCHHAIKQDDIFIVNDASKHKEFKNNPLVTEAPFIRFYAGVPLEVDNYKIGTLCVIDYKARKLSANQKSILLKLAEQIVAIFKLRHEKLVREETAKDYKEMSGVLEDINSLHYKKFTTEKELFADYLRVGSRHLGLEFGIISEIEGERYTVKTCISPEDEINEGDIFELGKTYCAKVIESGKTITHSNVGSDPEMNKHPVYLGLGLEMYIGCPIKVGEKTLGTINFSTQNVRKTPFRPLELNLIEILAKAIGNRLKIKRAQDNLKRKTDQIKQHQMDNEILRESSELGLWKWNLKTNEIEYDNRLYEMLGYKPSEIEQSLSTWEKLTHPDDKGLSYGEMKKYVTGQSDSFEIVFRVKHADGRWIPIMSKGKILQFDETGKPLIFCGTHFDMSKLKAQEVESEKLKQIATRVQEIAKIGGWKFTLEDQSIIWSDEVYRIHGLKVGSVVPLEKALNYYSSDDQERISNCMTAAIEDHIPWEGTYEFTDAKGVKKWVKTFGEPMLSEEGTVFALRGYFQDVSESVNRQKEVEKLRDLAEEANRAKSQFLANMSHELRTPLNAVIGYSELLIEDASSEQVELKEDLNKIRNSGKHLLNLINQVLDLSKVEAGKKEANIESIEISKLGSAVETIVGNSVTKNGNSLQIDLASLPPKINTDFEMLKQILINLVANAAKFTKDGKVSVKGYVDHHKGAEMYIFEVRDNGIGIPEERLSTIFHEFSQADDVISRDYGGTGLGLSISKRFAGLLKGSLEVESQLGKGSNFRLVLPSGYELAEVENIQNITETKKERILIIDDDKEAREITKRSLAGLDIDILEAADGVEGCSLAFAKHPSLIILDISMPNVNGWEALKRLKSDPKTKFIPVIIVSMVDQQQVGLELGANVYFMKPVKKNILVNSVKNHILKKAS